MRTYVNQKPRNRRKLSLQSSFLEIHTYNKLRTNTKPEQQNHNKKFQYFTPKTHRTHKYLHLLHVYSTKEYEIILILETSSRAYGTITQ